MVSKTYRDGSVDRPVLRGVSVNFARGEMTSLTGVSGSGKSTLISLLAGLVLPDSGRVVFDGEDITEMDDAARARLRARRVGIVLQS
ncbi:MAG TPA: ATP-binding cassette domain-containing protein, partial [Actinomycetota bacterium]